MNKIFKVIFNKAKGIFVVTGENAKAQAEIAQAIAQLALIKKLQNRRRQR